MLGRRKNSLFTQVDAEKNASNGKPPGRAAPQCVWPTPEGRQKDVPFSFCTVALVLSFCVTFWDFFSKVLFLNRNPEKTPFRAQAFSIYNDP